MMSLPAGLRARFEVIHPALRRAAANCAALGVRVAAYVGALALLAVLAMQVWNEIPLDVAVASGPSTDWVKASRPMPAFALSQFDFGGRGETYEVVRHHSGGGRRDVMRWSLPGESVAVEMEIYRPGQEAAADGSIEAIAARMDPIGTRQAQTAGMIETKFGAMTLLTLAAGNADARSCTGFVKTLTDPQIRLSGFSCLGDTAVAQRATVGCMVDRLMLLSAGSDSRLAELFARAELKRRTCPTTAGMARSGHWLAGIDNPELRGSF